MDVNATLSKIRKLCSDTELASSTEDAARIGAELAEAVGDLDDWVTMGGYLPADWSAKRAVPTQGV